MFEMSELVNILQVATVSTFEDVNSPGLRIEVDKCNYKPCERCRKYVCTETEDLCPRCVSVINSLVDCEIQGIKSC